MMKITKMKYFIRVRTVTRDTIGGDWDYDYHEGIVTIDQPINSVSELNSIIGEQIKVRKSFTIDMMVPVP